MNEIRLALILAVQVEIEAMKVENDINKHNGLPPAFCREYFLEKAEEFRNLACRHDDQL